MSNVCQLVPPLNEDAQRVIGIARICHEVNKAYCESINDKSASSWEDAPAWQKQSAIEGVRAHLAAGGISPRESHNLWCDHKLADGWSWGMMKDVDKKKHPCLVPYDQLPAHQRAKDYLFAGVVGCFITKGGDPSGK